MAVKDRAFPERLYEWVTDEDPEGHTCDAIPEEACREAPRNFLLNAANGAATKLAEQIASPGLVLSWLLATLGAPVALVGLLEPVRQGGSLLPQLVVSGKMRAYARRKWFWVAAGVTQAISLLVMLFAALTMNGAAAGWTIVGALAVFSAASGVGSVAFSDVMGKTIPKGKRGQLLGLRSTIGGAFTILAGLILYGRVGANAGVGVFVVLLAVAATLWALAAFLFSLTTEEPGATTGSRNTLSEAKSGLGLLVRVPGFRRFIIARAFLLSVELSIPFYSLRAREITSAGGGLGLFIVALGVAALIGSPIWGRLSDRNSNRLVMGLGAAAGTLAAAGALFMGLFVSGNASPYLYVPIFLLVGLAQSAIRVGRKSYLVDAAPTDERPLYKAVANTTVGLLTLSFAALGLLAQVLGVDAVLIVLLALGLLGVAACWYMPEADRMVVSARRAGSAP